MKVRLRDLKPNPMRDFAIDPLDESIIERLRASIRHNGFWGGVVARQKNGHFEIAAGQHRVDSGILEGIEEAEIHVADLDDRQMIRIYAEENATQRGSAHSTARAGSVASGLRQCAYDVLTGHIAEISAMSQKGVETAQGNSQSEKKGIGARLIYEHYLQGVPGITIATVQSDLASLKAAGAYTRIIQDVAAQIEAEREEAERRAALAVAAAERSRLDAERREAETALWELEQANTAAARAKKTAQTASAIERTFDFQGVSAHLTTAHHLREFRDVVTDAGVSSYLPVDQQAFLAKRLVDRAATTGEELSGFYIRKTIGALVTQMHAAQNQMTAREEQQLLAADWRRQLKDLVFYYGGALRNVAGYGCKLLEHLENAPEDGIRPVSASLVGDVVRALEVINKVKEGLK